MDYINLNKASYDKLATQYSKRTHEIGDDFWINIYNDIDLKNKKVLEIGPGSGRNLNILKKLDCDVMAVELSEKMCEIISNESPEIEVVNANVLDCDFEDESFDVIILSVVIHNFPLNDAKKVLKKVNKWLKDDGYIIISTTINEVEDEGIFEKKDYSGSVSRFRHIYTKESFENIVFESDFNLYKPYIVKENDRNKVWYVMVCNKK